jgi:hypothetical protein
MDRTKIISRRGVIILPRKGFKKGTVDLTTDEARAFSARIIDAAIDDGLKAPGWNRPAAANNG